MSIIDVMSDAAGALDYAADALEAPVGSHMRAATRELKAARDTVAAMLAALTLGIECLSGLLEPISDQDRLEYDEDALEAMRAALARAKGETK